MKAGFTISQARTWEHVFVVAGPELFSLVEPALLKLLHNSGAEGTSPERCKQAAGTEVLAGACRAACGWSLAQQARVWEKAALPLLAAVISVASDDVLSDWEQCLLFIMRKRDPRRFGALFKWLESCELRVDTDTKLCVGVLKMWSAVLRLYGWRVEGLVSSRAWLVSTAIHTLIRVPKMCHWAVSSVHNVW